MTVHPSVGFVPGVCTAPLIQALAPVRAVSELNRTDGQQPLHSRLRYGLCRYDVYLDKSNLSTSQSKPHRSRATSQAFIVEQRSKWFTSSSLNRRDRSACMRYGIRVDGRQGGRQPRMASSGGLTTANVVDAQDRARFGIGLSGST